MRLRALPVLSLTLAALSLLVARPAAGSPPEPANPLKLSFKVIMYEGGAPSYYPLGDEEGASMGHVITHFRRLPGAAPEGRAATVRKLLLNHSREGNGARVSVFAHGEGGAWTEEEKVAEYFVAEGEEYTVMELLSYGIEPLKVGVVRRANAEVPPPSVSNRTTSVEVVSIEVKEAGPTYELRLRNNSGKRIRAVEVRMLKNEQPGGSRSRFFSGVEPCAAPGESWTMTLEFGWNFKVGEGGHQIEPPNRVIVDSALFADGSYEGDAGFAARAAAEDFGRRAQLARALSLLESWRAPARASALHAHADLTARFKTLRTTADDALMTQFARLYPGLSSAETAGASAAVEQGLRHVRGRVLLDLERLGKKLSSETDLDSLREWAKQRAEMVRRVMAAR
ncbi:MAG TPA: hypothetical protein VEY09_08095 [Pyrinomonadaceae bacterium]|nr:hypothetical protein [Pyrinomonadaceae bacterium]